jgi:hypothetical protein
MRMYFNVVVTTAELKVASFDVKEMLINEHFRPI